VVPVYIEDEPAMLALGGRLARAVLMNQSKGCVIYLIGDLGAGKTTLTRGVLRGLGHRGAVKSPTFTLVEPYELGDLNLYHFDLYRLSDPEELEYIGIRDYLAGNAVTIVEWPEKGAGVLPAADLSITICYVDKGREVSFEAVTPHGESIISQLN
jgi:tRNA threonylcarbamoyladenosine biosynthesis protein TsaE